MIITLSLGLFLFIGVWGLCFNFIIEFLHRRNYQAVMNSDSFDISAIDCSENTPFEQERSLFSLPQPSTSISSRDSKKITDTDNIQTHCQPKTESLQQGSFLKALQKFQEQISYQSQVFDIYHNAKQHNNTQLFKSFMKLQRSEKYIMDFGKKTKLEGLKSKIVIKRSKSKSTNSKSNLKLQKPHPILKPQISQYYAGSIFMTPIPTGCKQISTSKHSRSNSKSRLNSIESPRSAKQKFKKPIIKQVTKSVKTKQF